MTDLFWPGNERAGELMSEATLLEAMVQVENAWLDALVVAGLAPALSDGDLTGLVTSDDVDELARSAEAAGNPVPALVALLRSRTGIDSATWLHRGLTSQDVLDTALMLALRGVLDRLLDELRSQVIAASILAERHVSTPMVGRTLTQHAVPTTFGAVAAGWLDGILDAADLVVDARALLPVQLGGAVGTLSAATELAALRGLDDPQSVAAELVTITAEALGLRELRPWHTSRGPVTRTADALVSCTDAWGHVATDVATLSRTEIAELAEPSVEGRGGSSTMPHKHNPVLSVLVRRAALAAPALASTLHTSSAIAGDQRPDGAWHAEWSTLHTLGRRTAVAGSQTTELLQGLHVDAERMRATLDRSADDVLAERRSIADLLDAKADPDPTTYLGIAEDLVAGAVERARIFLEENA
ncbi:lyase family protein [Aeromicrobium sp. 9AM]|uniref:lyase family protein n=1 Tax=Aeromicrobium sp. 9AM TaxID=2653126 RepID=UPI0012F01BC2|nr:lyase family protein [Aeromicrobium sp. 9AM]VXB13992.1 3-carboxy-cis,cis-muconate cycloisomerase [Aeromicrobium sp. 9AM]